MAKAAGKKGKWDVGFDGYEERAGYNGPEPKPGIYEAKLHSLEEHDSQNSETSLHWIFEITEDGEYAGWRGHAYTNLDEDSALWKTQQYVKAIQGGSETPMNLDPSKHEAIVKKATPVLIRTKFEKYEGEDKARIRVVLPVEDGDAAPASKGKGKKGKKEPWQDDED